MLAGLDLHSGKVFEEISNTHKSGDFIVFLKKLDDAYPKHQRIRLLLDNHSAHISKETRGYLETVPQRFEFVFMPTHGSWLNLVENMFSKCFVMAGRLTPNNSASAFCVSHTVSSLKNTSTFTAPSGAV